VSSGFNTDVQAGERIFHVQTEDRGPSPYVIDTAVYQNGRVLYRRSSDYEHFANSSEFNAEDLRVRVEEQHRCVIEDLRSGELDVEIAAATEKAARAAGIEVQLLNPKSWLTGGNISLDLEILRRGDRQPEEGAQVEASIEGAGQDVAHTGTSDGRGRAKIEFPLPALGKGDLTLVIQARASSGKDEIRFAMRSKPKAPPAGAAS
jgi:hypothetical protein